MTTLTITNSNGDTLLHMDEEGGAGRVDSFDKQEVFLVLTKALASLMDVGVNDTNRVGIPMNGKGGRRRPPKFMASPKERPGVKQRPRDHLTLLQGGKTQ